MTRQKIAMEIKDEDGHTLFLQRTDGSVSFGTPPLSHSAEPTLANLDMGDGGEVKRATGMSPFAESENAALKISIGEVCPTAALHFDPPYLELVKRVRLLEEALSALHKTLTNYVEIP